MTPKFKHPINQALIVYEKQPRDTRAKKTPTVPSLLCFSQYLHIILYDIPHHSIYKKFKREQNTHKKPSLTKATPLYDIPQHLFHTSTSFYNTISTLFTAYNRSASCLHCCIRLYDYGRVHHFIPWLDYNSSEWGKRSRFFFTKFLTIRNSQHNLQIECVSTNLQTTQQHVSA